ncbi:MAG TPA: hypothetical protein VGD37_03935 [Kofleriaceae bacterium]
MQRTVLAMVLSLSLCSWACVVETAQGPRAVSPQATTEEPTVCKDEQPTGSLVTRHSCRSPEQRHDDQMAKQSWMNYWPPNPLRGDPTYPGVDARHPHD